ncbi:sensor histidine kinase [Streptomyces sp. WZ-12]|uniref:sensor histidine kinase n=1 Tax=Streptomyces sp. WZ-12 TaxID=3030210 RepID=UPI0023813D92|nr:HAMP domain-containing sensor histidine kinase [Streptomyces sp. WZ-12]
MKRRQHQAAERLRLTALYATLLLLAQGGLITLVYVLLRRGFYNKIYGAITTADVVNDTAPPPTGPSPTRVHRHGSAENLAATIEQTALHQLLTVCLIALAVFAALSIALSWWISGRILRPVAAITEQARQLSSATLHERIALDAPPGELKRLADTFDDMLDRMEQLITAQRRFAANAAHELRTPLAQQRAAAEIGLAGTPGPDHIADIRQELIRISEHSTHLIDGLLLLATSDRGLERHDPVRLDQITTQVCHHTAPTARDHQVALDLQTQPLHIEGDPILLEQLVHNLIDNAVRYNHPTGHVTIRTSPENLTVANTGPVIPADVVPRLFEPFHRLAERRKATGEGAGLGLSIVANIAQAHQAHVTAEANPDGGLTITIHFTTPTHRWPSPRGSDTKIE